MKQTNNYGCFYPFKFPFFTFSITWKLRWEIASYEAFWRLFHLFFVAVNLQEGEKCIKISTKS